MSIENRFNLLFWNLKKNAIESYLSKCILENNIDLAIVSEFESIDFSHLSKKLKSDYCHIEGMGGCEKITLIAKNGISIIVKREQDRYVLYEVRKNMNTYILAGVHLQDRRNSDCQRRIAKIGRLVNDIKNLEESSKCKNTIIIGDFNANPYDTELLSMNAFNAVLFKDEILRSETNTVDGIQYRRFYNPILHFISEDTKMYGSYYYKQDNPTPIWHCLDQVLVSKNLANCIRSIRYLKTINNKSLVKKIKPDNEISDHLPLLVSITET